MTEKRKMRAITISCGTNFIFRRNWIAYVSYKMKNGASIWRVKKLILKEIIILPIIPSFLYAFTNADLPFLQCLKANPCA